MWMKHHNSRHKWQNLCDKPFQDYPVSDHVQKPDSQTARTRRAPRDDVVHHSFSGEETEAKMGSNLPKVSWPRWAWLEARFLVLRPGSSPPTSIRKERKKHHWKEFPLVVQIWEPVPFNFSFFLEIVIFLIANINSNVSYDVSSVSLMPSWLTGYYGLIQYRAVLGYNLNF